MTARTHSIAYARAPMQRYREEAVLGSGAFGTVVRAHDTVTGETVAIKTMHEHVASRADCALQREVWALQQLNHANIVRMHRFHWARGRLSLVLEHMDTTLRDVIERHAEAGVAMDESLVRVYAHQVLQALAHMHARQVMHCDLAPGNVLVTRTHAKVADFGLATHHNHDEQTHAAVITTLWYRAPEVALGDGRYGPAIDVWSFAAIVAEMYLLGPLFPGQGPLGHIHAVARVLGSPSPTSWPQGHRAMRHQFILQPTYSRTPLATLLPGASADPADMLEAALQYDPQRRPTAAQLLQHPYLTGVTPAAVGAASATSRPVWRARSPSPGRSDNASRGAERARPAPRWPTIPSAAHP